MLATDTFDRYKELLISLKSIANDSQNRVLKDDPDILFSSNVNFFVKSYLINTCTYLEAYLQDIAFNVAREICTRANSARIPHNFLQWKTGRETKEKDFKYAEAIFSLSRKEIAEEISANPYKTIKLFRLLGIDLSQQDKFQFNKDLINSIVTKRNNIIHHNDAANDISFSDIETYIDVFIDYMVAIKEAVNGAVTQQVS